MLISVIFDISSGLSTGHFAWAFHSVAEEELLNMLPAMQKDDPTWSELRAMGVGWWVRNSRILRKCIEKVSIFIWVKTIVYFEYLFNGILSLLIVVTLF